MPAREFADAQTITRLCGSDAWRVRCVPETGSTNRDVTVLAGEGEPAGLALIAEHQTAGRGRFDRVWEAPPGASIGMSVLLRPTRPMRDWSWLPLLAGLAVVRGIRETTPQARGLVLKWPNDVLVDEGPGAGKLCGILCERHETPTGPAAVMGIGLNIDLAPDELPVPTATSLAGAGFASDKNEVIAAVLRHLRELDEIWERRGHLAEAYAAACGTIGARVRVQLSKIESVEGTAIGVNEAGCLQVRTPDGLQTFAAGDVFHLRPAGR